MATTYAAHGPARTRSRCGQPGAACPPDRPRKPVTPPIRELAPDERELLVEHFLRLSPRDRSMRFMGTMPDARIAQYCRREDHERLVLGYFADGVLRGAGEIVFLARPAWRGACEVALSVELPWQRHGVGTELLTRMTAIARERGATPLTVFFLRENRRTVELARKFGIALHIDGSEVTGTLVAPRPERSWPPVAHGVEH